MAITINGMSLKETLSLTDIFIKSGELMNLKRKYQINTQQVE